MEQQKQEEGKAEAWRSSQQAELVEEEILRLIAQYNGQMMNVTSLHTNLYLSLYLYLYISMYL